MPHAWLAGTKRIGLFVYGTDMHWRHWSIMQRYAIKQRAGRRFCPGFLSVDRICSAIIAPFRATRTSGIQRTRSGEERVSYSPQNGRCVTKSDADISLRAQLEIITKIREQKRREMRRQYQLNDVTQHEMVKCPWVEAIKDSTLTRAGSMLR